jgi:hypothetical protein
VHFVKPVKFIFPFFASLFVGLLFAAQEYEPISSAELICSRTLMTLIDGNTRLLAHLETDRFYSESEMVRLFEIFNLGEESTRRKNPEKISDCINPVYIPLSVKMENMEIISWKFKEPPDSIIVDHRDHHLSEDDYLLFIRLVKRTMDPIRTHDLPFYKKFDGREFDILLFGFRYFIKNGTRLDGVYWHQHGGKVSHQGLIFLKKPNDLTGGEFLLAEGEYENVYPMPDGKILKSGKFINGNNKTPLKFNLAVNRLLTFEGAHTAHATEDFKLPTNPDDRWESIDVLGVEIHLPR